MCIKCTWFNKCKQPPPVNTIYPTWSIFTKPIKGNCTKTADRNMKKNQMLIIPFSPQTLKLKIASALNHILFKIQIEFSCFDLY